MVTAKVWKLTRRPDGEPTQEDFTCVEEQLPPCKDGDVIVEAECLSVDPHMRFLVRHHPLNSTMPGEQVARVTQSKSPQWPVGSYMLATVGWRSHAHLSSSFLQTDSTNIQQLPDLENLPKSLGLGVLGMPGNTAYVSFIERVRPKAGETVVVSGAAGAVGSAVVQLAKLSGCKVIAFAGTEDKVAWLRELGADHVFNYKTVKISDALSKAAPEKVNIYYDCVGGKLSGEVMLHMAKHGQVLVCGAISTYNKRDSPGNPMDSPFNSSLVLWEELKIQGFLVYNWRHRWEHSFAQMKRWLQEGKLKYKETVVQGFENMPKAFIGLFSGTNTGKAVVLP